MEKQCTKCGKVKDVERFHRHRRRSDGRCSQCKECCKEYCQLNSEELRKRYAKYRNENKEKTKRAQKRYFKTKAGRAAKLNGWIKYSAKYPEKYKANRALNKAIGNGTVFRGPCGRCSSTEHIHGHHDDYSKPLDVIWLCRQCHIDFHNEKRLEGER